MNKQELTRSLTIKYGNLLTVNEVAAYVGADRGTVRRNILYGLPYLPIGKSKKYSASDIAQRIVDMSTR